MGIIKAAISVGIVLQFASLCAAAPQPSVVTIVDKVWCAHIEAATGCLDDAIKRECPKKCAPNEDKDWCQYIKVDACSGVAESCPTKCAAYSAQTTPAPVDPSWCVHVLQVSADTKCLEESIASECTTLCAAFKVMDCEKLKLEPPQNGWIRQMVDKNNEHVKFECETGYEINGDDEAKCLKTGKMSAKVPQCQRKDCGEVQPPQYGSVIGNSHLYNDNVEFACNPGYELVGDAEAMCLDTGSWSVETPQCQRKDCGELQPPQNGSKIGFAHKYNDRIKFACDEGFDLMGDNEALCEDTGRWSIELPQCNRKDCGELQPPRNGSVIGEGHLYNDRVQFACDLGYGLNGTNETVCLATGSWSVNTPQCEPIDEEWCNHLNTAVHCMVQTIVEHCPKVCIAGLVVPVAERENPLVVEREDPEWCAHLGPTQKYCPKCGINRLCKKRCTGIKSSCPDTTETTTPWTFWRK